MKNFFISYNRADHIWAEWIAWELEEAGYTTILQAWDFLPGSNFVVEMQKAVTQAERTIAVLSPDYLNARYTQPEWAAAFAQDPTGQNGLLLPVLVRTCDVTGLLGPIVHIDLVELEESKARDSLLSGVRPRVHDERLKPPGRPIFPGSVQRSVSEQPRFPGAVQSSWWNISQRRNAFFTGRESILNALHTTLLACGRAAVSGFGGIGKTQIAIEYAYRYRAEYRAVLWASAASSETLITDFTAIARLLRLPVKEIKEQSQIIAAVKEWLGSETRWLLILDNADIPDLLEEFLPLQPQGHILLTSRAQVFDRLGIGQPIEPGEMAPDEASQFVLKRTGRLSAGPAELAAAQELARELGYLPLALEQAGAFIAKHKSSFRDYLASYRSKGIELLKRLGPVTGEYRESVATTWQLNFEQVEQASAAAADLLRASAFFSPDKIPLDLVRRGAPELGTALALALVDVDDDPTILDEILEPLTQYSLIRRDIDDESYAIHRLVQMVLKHQMDEVARRQWAERCVRALNRTFPNSREITAWPSCERLLPHALVCAEFVRKVGLTSPEASLLCNQAGVYLHERGRYQEAEPLHQQALAIREQALGPQHPDVATSLNNLALLYRAQGKYGEAEPLYQRALAIWEQTLGPQHPNVATSLNNLALLYHDQDKYGEAEPLYQRALAIWEQTLGPRHPNTMTCRDNLAALHRA
jgi:tetratricopeptide (TPR) repeat protein